MKKLTALLVTAIILLGVGCATMSKFDQNTYDAATRLKSRSLSLVAHATEPAATYRTDIVALQADLASQVSYEKAKHANTLSAKQWQLLTATDSYTLGLLLKDWAGGKTYSQTFVVEESQLIGDIFDQIIALEGRKIK